MLKEIPRPKMWNCFVAWPVASDVDVLEIIFDDDDKCARNKFNFID